MVQRATEQGERTARVERARVAGGTRRDPGLRLVAAFELTKGVIVLLAGVLFLAFLKHDLPTTARRLVHVLGTDPHGPLAAALVQAARSLAGVSPGALLALVLAYAAVRAVEGYGLWCARPWGEWFGIASGSVYVPFELLHAARRPTAMSVGVLALNLLVVAYLAWHRWHRARSASASAADGARATHRFSIEPTG